jgi:hypothetical protein
LGKREEMLVAIQELQEQFRTVHVESDIEIRELLATAARANAPPELVTYIADYLDRKGSVVGFMRPLRLVRS